MKPLSRRPWSLIAATLSAICWPNGLIHGQAESADFSGRITGGGIGTYQVEVPEELRVRRGLPNLLPRLQAGEPVTVAYLGGSITRRENGWADRTFSWLEQRFPDATLTQVNAAVSGTGADFAACRLANDVLPHQPDLVFIEYRVNGGGAEPARAIEGLIRQLRRELPEADLVLVYTIGRWMLDDFDAGRQFSFGQTMETLANAYGLPSIDLGVEVIRQREAGTLLFQGDEAVEGQMLFSRDGVHPGDAGHQLYADIVARSFETIFAHTPDATATIAPRPWPDPVYPEPFEQTSLQPIGTAELNAGWETVNSGTDPIYRADRRRTEAMLREAVRTNHIGASYSVEWEGTLLVLTHIPQGEGTVIEVATDGAPPERLELNQASPRLVAGFASLTEQSPGVHTTTVTVRQLPDEGWFYAGQFLVMGASED